jgi:hypothetical protein
MSTADHVLLTRFNLPSAGVESLIRAKDGWLRERDALFERYTIPSVRGQDTAAFRWLVYFDPASPGWLRSRLAPYVDQGLFAAAYREVVGPAEILADLKKLIPHPGDALVTTNLDNDDGISLDFVGRVQSAAEGTTRVAIYLNDGLVLSPSGLYRHTDRTNAFCSVRESWSDPVTCWSDWHNLLPDRMPAIHVDGPPSWLQVVHGGNVSNRTRGRRVRPELFEARFPGLLADVPAPGPLTLARDLVVDRPGRWLRESGRALVKRLVMRVGGKDAVDRSKRVASALSGRCPRGRARA